MDAFLQILGFAALVLTVLAVLFLLTDEEGVVRIFPLLGRVLLYAVLAVIGLIAGFGYILLKTGKGVYAFLSRLVGVLKRKYIPA